MDTWRFISGLVALGGPALILLYDALAAQIAGKEATISAVVRAWQKSFPELAYIVAALFFWVWLHLFFRSIVCGE